MYRCEALRVGTNRPRADRRYGLSFVLLRCFAAGCPFKRTIVYLLQPMRRSFSDPWSTHGASAYAVDSAACVSVKARHRISMADASLQPCRTACQTANVYVTEVLSLPPQPLDRRVFAALPASTAITPAPLNC